MNIFSRFSLKTRMKLMRASNHLALITSVGAIFACFSSVSWIYLAILFGSVLYLATVTHKFIIISNNKCLSDINTISYDRQVTALQTRISAVSNSMAIAVSVLYMFLEISQQVKGERYLPASLSNEYITGFIRLIIFYIVADKAHSSRILIQTYKQMADTLKHLSIGKVTKFGSKLYPVMYIDGFRLSEKRYCVAICDDELIVIFTPALSLSNDSTIEYDLTEPENADTLYDEQLCKETEYLSHDGIHGKLVVRPRCTSCPN